MIVNNIDQEVDLRYRSTMSTLNPKAVLLMIVGIAIGWLAGSYYPRLGTERGMAFGIVGTGLFILFLSRNSRSRY